MDTAYDELAQILREMAGRFGPTAFTDRRRLVSLLSDRLPENRREIKVVASAVDERVFDTLARARPDQLGMEIERLAANLENGLGIRSDIAVPVVQACAYGLSLGPLPSAAVRAPIGLPPVPVSQDGWVGASEPVSWVGVSTPAQPATASIAPNALIPTLKPNVASARPNWVKWAGAGGGLFIGLVIFGAMSFKGVVHEDPQPAPAPAPPLVSPDPTPVPQPQPAPTPQPQPQPAPTPQPQPAPLPQAYYGQEDRDYGIPPQSTLKTEVGSPTPLTVPGARTVTTTQVWNEMSNQRRMILVDALQSYHQNTIANATYIPYAGQPGSFNDKIQAALTKELNRLNGGHREIPIVFFCIGVNCWESYNAALRAIAAGFPNVFWYRGGLTSWNDAGFPMQPTPH